MKIVRNTAYSMERAHQETYISILHLNKKKWYLNTYFLLVVPFLYVYFPFCPLPSQRIGGVEGSQLPCLLVVSFWCWCTWNPAVLGVFSGLLSANMHRVLNLEELRTKWDRVRNTWRWRHLEVYSSCCQATFTMWTCARHFVLHSFFPLTD